jgi:hypothetical protein
MTNLSRSISISFSVAAHISSSSLIVNRILS